MISQNRVYWFNAEIIKSDHEEYEAEILLEQLEQSSLLVPTCGPRSFRTVW